MTADSFSSEYAAGFPRMVAYAAKRGIPDAENLAQQAWAQAWEKREQYCALRGASFRTWVYRIMDNVIRDQMRRPALRNVLFMCELPDLPVLSPDATAAVDVESLLQELAPDQRLVIQLFYLNGMTYREIEAATGRPKNTLKVLTFRGLRQAAAAAKIRIPACVSA